MLGTKIYYSNVTGNVLYIRQDMNGVGLRETTFEEDYKERIELRGFNKEIIELLNFEYGEYRKLSNGSTSVSVDLETKELIFSYEELPQEPIEPTEIELMQEEIKALKEEINILKTSISEVLCNG